jgi:hypothetical protein
MVTRKLRQVLLVGGLLVLALPALAQELTVSARVDSNAITIGDWLTITFEARYRGEVAIQHPELPDSIPGLEVVRQEAPAPTQENGETIARALVTVTAFDSGSFVFPAIRVPSTLPGDTARHVATTTPVAILVHGVAVDTSQAIKDIKPPLGLPLTFLEILPYLLGVLALAGVIWLILYIRKKRKKGESILPVAPPRPPHEIAMEALAALEAEQLWQRGMVKEFHSRVTGIVRAYIEERFRVRALEQTSDEILEAGAIRALPPETGAHLRGMLVRADLVKFAKYQPQRDEHDASLVSAKAFVAETTALAEPAPAEPAPSEAAP